MAKLALIIGVSDHEPGLTPLPGAIKDVDAMQRVLQHPEVGGFDDVKVLLNPEPQGMQEEIQALFSGRTKDDLVLLFFSGHGVKDDNGRLHLATRSTRKTLQGDLILATAVPARFVQDIMSNSRSRRQVVILDCCFSGAFAEGWSAKDDGSVDVKAQLGGEGRAVLTSSTSTQYSFEQEGSDLSTYTRYLVEGIETGAADLDSDGVISIDELHEYAKGKVQEAAPAMKPEIYAVKEGYKIYLSQAPIEDPKLRYRREVEHCASRGEISAVSRYTLDTLRESLELLPEEVAAIEDEVLQPYRKYQKKLQRYEQVLVEALQHEHTLSSGTHNELKRLQRVLSLRDEDIAQIEAQVTSQKKVIQPSGETAAVQVQPLLHSEEVAPVNPTTQAVAKGQAKTLTPSSVSLPRKSINPAAILRNPKLLLGGGFAAFLLAAFFLIKMPQQEQNVEPTSTASPTVSSVAPTSARDFYTRGTDKYNSGDYEAAIADFSQAIKLYSDYAEAYNDRGLAKSDLGDQQGAIADYNQAIKLDPDYAFAYNNRGLAKYDLGDKQGAIADYDQAIKLDPSYAFPYNNRGLAKYDLGDKQGAIADHDQAIKLNPNYVNSYTNRGRAKSDLGDQQGAIADYNQAIEIDPSFAIPYNNRGFAKFNLGDKQGAIADYDQAIKIDPSFAKAFYNRGDAKYHLGDKQGAIADYQEAAELYQQQGNTEAYQNSLEQIKKLQ